MDRTKSRKDIERQYERLIWSPQMTKEHFERASEARKRYLGNIYRTRASKADRREIRRSVAEGGKPLSDAMDRIINRQYTRNQYMGLNKG